MKISPDELVKRAEQALKDLQNGRASIVTKSKSKNEEKMAITRIENMAGMKAYRKKAI